MNSHEKSCDTSCNGIKKKPQDMMCCKMAIVNFENSPENKSKI